MRKYLFLLLGITAITTVLIVIAGSVRAWAARNPADQLLYLSQVATNSGDLSTLYVHDLRTDTQHALVKDFLGWGADAVWSPEGDRIAFSMFEDGVVERNIHILDVLSGELERITGDGSTTDHNSPSWSPDGTRLVYHALDPAEDSDLDIYIHDLTNDQQARVYAAPGQDYAPAWSPDGRLILQTNANREIVGLEVSSGRLTYRLVGSRGAAYDGSWAPDSRRFVFADWESNQMWHRLYVAHVDESISRLLTGGFDGTQAEPAWSLDGEWIAYTNFIPGVESRIYKLRPDGGEPVAITPPGESYRQPHWRP